MAYVSKRVKELKRVLGDSAEYGIPMKEYHKRAKVLGGILSSHAARTLTDNPYKFKVDKEGKEKDPTSAMKMGSAMHKLILEPKTFKKEFKCSNEGPVNPKTKKPYGHTALLYVDWKETQEKLGITILTPDEYEQALLMSCAVKARKDLMENLKGGLPEITITAVLNDVVCQVRPDYTLFRKMENGQDGLVMADCKKCSEMEFFWYDATKKFGYNFQLSFYRLVVSAATGVPVRNIYQPLIACEGKPYYTPGEHFFSHSGLLQTDKIVLATIEKYKECIKNNSWKHGYEKPTLISA